MTLNDFIATAQHRLENTIKRYLVESPQPANTLKEAMTYAVINGGKRIRPLLVYLSGYVLGAKLEQLDSAACAIEFIHTYSLIHDDLPAMDNSDLRRGKPTCHKVFGDAAAILAGDALQPLAFEVIANETNELSADQRLRMIQVLSKASGAQGMVAGQTLDLAGATDLSSLIEMYRLKTGELLTASVQLGAIAAGADIHSLKQYASNLGLAFQIQDDLLDIEGSSQLIGKPQGLDVANHKVTYPSLVGIEQSRAQVTTLFKEGLHSIAFLGEKSKLLSDFANKLMQRNN